MDINTVEDVVGHLPRIRILYSVQATHVSVVIEPTQVCRQADCGVGQGIGFALTGNFHVDENGVMVNPKLRNYKIPTCADIPRTHALTAYSTDSIEPTHSKGIAEICINPVAPALVNAVARATNVRYRTLPLSPERAYSPLGSPRLAPTA